MAAKRPTGSFALKVLYGDTFTMAVGFYMLVPLLAYHFLQDLTLTIAIVAVLTAVRTAAQNGLMPIAGWVADRIHFRRAILIGVLIRALGFALLGTVESVPLLAIASVLTGLGGALFHPASYAAYAALTTGTDRVKVYSTREVVSNVGFVVGPDRGWLPRRRRLRYGQPVSGGDVRARVHHQRHRFATLKRGRSRHHGSPPAGRVR